VSPSGSDANNGVGPDASHASNKPWLTIGKALGAAGISSGDTVYIGPGTYREVVTVAMTSAVAETSVLGDPGNAQGFKNGSGVLLDPAEVVWTAFTTSDTTAPSSSDTLNLSGRDYLTFQFITFYQGTGNAIDISTQTSTNITFRDCVIVGIGSSAAILIDGAFGVTQNLLFERLAFLLVGTSQAFLFQNDTGSGSDYDLSIVVRNCLIIGPRGPGFLVTPSGAGGNKPGGVSIYNCTLINSYNIQTTSAVSTSFPVNIYNNVIYETGSTQSLIAATLGQIVENYNYIVSTTTHTNVTQGADTVVNNNRAQLFNFGAERIYGFAPRMFMEPKALSWPLTFGNDGTYTTSDDFLGLPRPGGGQSATKGIGYLGRGNTFGKETGTVRTGSNAMSATGPACQDFQLPVDATNTTISAYVRWDATYAGTKPQMKVVNGGECGVADASTTATGSSGSWEQLSLNFTPARAGIVTVRFCSNDTNGAGKMFVDDFAVT
jgi:hypothetical protein